MAKIEGGYYIKARRIQESRIATQPPHVREIWDWLIKEANHKEKKYSGFTVKRGQLFRTYNEIREGLHWMVGYRKMMYNENQTKKAMKFLREDGMITTMKELGGVLITICNYDTYQDPKNYEGTIESTTERTNEEPMKNHPIPHNNKNDKNVKNDKNKEERKNIIKDDEDFLSSETDQFIQIQFIRCFNRNPKPVEVTLVQNLINEHSEKEVEEAFRKAAEQNKNTVAYVRGILTNKNNGRNLGRDGITDKSGRYINPE